MNGSPDVEGNLPAPYLEEKGGGESRKLHGSVLIDPLFGGDEFVFVYLGNTADH